MGGAGVDGYERIEGAAVIKMIYIILTLVSGILLSGVWYGFNFLIQICLEKSKVKFLERYSVIAASVIPLIFILKYNRLELWNYHSLTDWKNWMILAVTVLLSAIVISINQVAEIPRGKELLLYALDGVCMEIPQRMMMQTFSSILLMHWGLNSYLAIPVTAFVWCTSICIQCLICKLKFDRKIVIEIVASFLFSMGAGLLLLKSGFIGLPMAGHFLERILSTIIRKIRR